MSPSPCGLLPGRRGRIFGRLHAKSAVEAAGPGKALTGGRGLGQRQVPGGLSSRRPGSGHVSGASTPHRRFSAAASGLVTSGAWPVISALRSHAVGGRSATGRAVGGAAVALRKPFTTTQLLASLAHALITR